MTQNLNCKMLAALCLAVLLVGCSTSKEELLPTGNHTMLELWNGSDGEGGTTRQSAAARDTLRRPLTDNEQRKGIQDDRSYSRTQESEISQQFSRLPNPDMVMYLYPHLAGGNAGARLQHRISFLQPDTVCDAW